MSTGKFGQGYGGEKVAYRRGGGVILVSGKMVQERQMDRLISEMLLWQHNYNCLFLNHPTWRVNSTGRLLLRVDRLLRLLFGDVRVLQLPLSSRALHPLSGAIALHVWPRRVVDQCEFKQGAEHEALADLRKRSVNGNSNFRFLSI